MRIIVCIISLCFIVSGQKRFSSDYFVKKYNLKLPEVTQEMLDITKLTHTSDSWEYFYQGNTEKLDSIVRKLTIERFPRNLQKDKYRYTNDTVYVTSVSVLVDSGGDTSSATNYKYTADFRTQIAIKPKTNCIWKSRFDERGIKLLDVNKCPGEKEFGGQVFNNMIKDEYIESIETYRGEIDSNSIRRYYLTPFDSIAADFMVKKGKTPFIVRFNTYNKKNKKQASFAFGIYSNVNEVLNFDYYTYTNTNKLHRVYHFEVKNRNAKDKEYELVNFTEYEYDKLGRKIKKTTKVMPDKKND
ncbi:MAG TPA: hypothetical protein VKY57_00875 [Chitinispirillaceae bacterium]|nr:hypothetical protein [Chitinispirillaceae bacterium]